MAYKPGQIMRLNTIDYTPKYILDVGAHTGQFYRLAKAQWPTSFVWMIEANECHENTLKTLINGTQDQYTIACLGDTEDKEVSFYTRLDKPHTEGASYYKEKAYWDIPQLVLSIPKRIKTLDNLFDLKVPFDLIKIDTQGSELDILSGGPCLCKRAKYIILEVSLIEVNENAPQLNQVLEFMKNYGFEEQMIIGEHYEGNNIVQEDVLFRNKQI